MARSFNGTSDVIRADGANLATLESGNVSFAAWVKASGAITNAVYYGEGVNGNNPHLQWQTNSGKWRGFLRDVNGLSMINGVSSALTLADGTWHHFVYSQSLSGSTVSWQVYIDGAADSTAHGTYGSTNASCTRVSIGALARSTTTNFFAGTLLGVASWSRSLSAAEAKSLANGLPASRLGPSHYWPLWGVDSPEPDIGNG